MTAEAGGQYPHRKGQIYSAQPKEIIFATSKFPTNRFFLSNQNLK